MEPRTSTYPGNGKYKSRAQVWSPIDKLYKSPELTTLIMAPVKSLEKCRKN